jgi:polyphosphate kinase 2 (PPK2 family)
LKRKKKKKRKTKEKRTYFKKMLLLFEGVDKSGKSTLIKNFTANNYTPGWKNTVITPVSSTFSI